MGKILEGMNIKKEKYIFIVIALFFLGLQFREVFFTNFDEHLTFGIKRIFEQWTFGITGIILLIAALFWDKIRPLL